MKIFVIGSRGIPNIQGGVETHCEELYPRLSNLKGHEITVLCRSCYVKNSNMESFKGVKLKSLFAPKNKALEAIIHSLLCVLYSGLKRPDIVHIHAVGPNLVAPLARILGIPVVMTHHGPDYERKKWGKVAKTFLKTGEWSGVKFANRVIVISEEIRKSISTKYGRYDANLIPNGVTLTSQSFDGSTLKKYGVNKKEYIFSLGRFVPEKGFDYLIRAFKKSGLSDKFHLVLAGEADHETPYSRELKELARNEGVILTGFIKGDTLTQLFSSAAIFVLPSFYEGLPISLLEAMSYNLPILASNIPANTQVELPESCYFPVGDEDILSSKLAMCLSRPSEPISYNMERYDWDKIALQTDEVYQTLL